VGDPALLDCVFESGPDVFLPDDAGKLMRPEFAGADLIGLGCGIGSACGQVDDL